MAPLSGLNANAVYGGNFVYVSRGGMPLGNGVVIGLKDNCDARLSAATQ
jgi:hypothetical protein